MTATPDARRGYRGYCSHQPFGGFRIPVPVQNLMLRDYAARNGLAFRLSVNELNFPGCHVALDTLLGELDALEGIVMASIFMLPAEPDRRAEIFKTVLGSGAALHAVLETMAIDGPDDVEQAEAVIRIRAALDESPRALPDRTPSGFPGFRSFTN